MQDVDHLIQASMSSKITATYLVVNEDLSHWCNATPPQASLPTAAQLSNGGCSDIDDYGFNSLGSSDAYMRR